MGQVRAAPCLLRVSNEAVLDLANAVDFDADHIAMLARFDKGDLYDSRLVDDLRKALVATGLYSVVAVQPEPSNVAAPDGTQYANLAVEQEAGPARTLAANAGYGTGQGIRAQGSWTHRNLFGQAESLRVDGQAPTEALDDFDAAQKAFEEDEALVNEMLEQMPENDRAAVMAASREEADAARAQAERAEQYSKAYRAAAVCDIRNGQ